MPDRQNKTVVTMSIHDVDTMTITQMGTTVMLDVSNDEAMTMATFDMTKADDVDTLLAFGRMWVEVMKQAVPEALEALNE